MNVVILSARTGWHTAELCRALAERGHVGHVLPYEALRARLGAGDADGLSSRDLPIFQADAVLARIIPGGSLEQIIYRVNALHWIERHGVPVMNSPRAIERSVDKFYASALLREAGLPVPHTVVCETLADAMTAVRAMGDVVIKPIFGSMGHGLVRVDNAELAFRMLRTLEQTRTVFYVQEAIDHGGRDVRAFVIGGRVVASIERTAPPGEWRTNVSIGGTARPIELPPEWESIAVRAASAIGADYAGVDLLPARDGRVFALEVNGIPGWHGVQSATGLDVSGALIDRLLERLRCPRPAPQELDA